MSIFTNLKIGDNDYKLRMSSAKVVEIEKKIGKNPINVMIDAKSGRIPLMGDILTIFWGSLTYYQHSISLEMAMDIYDEYIADGHTFEDFVTDVLIGIFKTAGYLKQNDTETDEEPDGEQAKN